MFLSQIFDCLAFALQPPASTRQSAFPRIAFRALSLLLITAHTPAYAIVCHEHATRCTTSTFELESCTSYGVWDGEPIWCPMGCFQWQGGPNSRAHCKECLIANRITCYPSTGTQYVRNVYEFCDAHYKLSEETCDDETWCWQEEKGGICKAKECKPGRVVCINPSDGLVAPWRPSQTKSCREPGFWDAPKPCGPDKFYCNKGRCTNRPPARGPRRKIPGTSVFRFD